MNQREKLNDFQSQAKYKLKHIRKVNPLNHRKDNRLSIITSDEFNYYIDAIAEDYHKAYKNVINDVLEDIDNMASKKLKALRPKLKGESKDGKYIQYFECPTCGRRMYYNWDNYCRKCGQEFNWEEYR